MSTTKRKRVTKKEVEKDKGKEVEEPTKKKVGSPSFCLPPPFYLIFTSILWL
jgi:hypothetical protein